MIFPGMARHMWHPPTRFTVVFIDVVCDSLPHLGCHSLKYHRNILAIPAFGIHLPCFRATMSNVHLHFILQLIAPPATLTGLNLVIALPHREFARARRESPWMTTLAETGRVSSYAVQSQFAIQCSPKRGRRLPVAAPRHS